MVLVFSGLGPHFKDKCDAIATDVAPLWSVVSIACYRAIIEVGDDRIKAESFP
jgi:hypothetical protein